MTTMYASSCLILGVCSLILNLFVIVALFRNRRRMLKNVFYVIVFNCAVLDLLRGVCLTLSTGLYIFWTPPPAYLLTYFKVTAFSKWILRQCNLITMLNLLVFTSNEFVVIRYPLHYRRYCRRRVILAILLGCWVVSVLFSVLVMLSSSRKSDDGERQDGAEGGEGMIILFILCYLCLSVVLVCYGFILRTIRRFHKQEEKGEFTSLESHKINNRTTTRKECAGCTERRERGQSKRCNSHRKWRTHLMSRHKYLIVIGTVLLVDILFLIPYSGIQIINFLQLRQVLKFTFFTRTIQWMMNILIGVHSVCQPLCYFRMTEFRRIACCHGRTPWNKSKSFSNHKSYVNTRSQMRDDEDGMELLHESPRARQQPLLEHARLLMAPINPQWGSNVVRFRAYGHQLSKVELNGKDKDSKPPLKRSRSEAVFPPIPTSNDTSTMKTTNECP